MVFGLGMLHANPVSVSQAKYVGQQFVQANYELSRQSDELTLVYTGTSYRGEACFYAFNVGDNGHVIVSADDYFRPIVGYSKEGVFPVDNMPDGLRYLLNAIIDNRTGHTGVASPQVAAEWNLVTQTGRLMSRNGGKASSFLVETKWNQDSPYNLYCPPYSGGPGGRCYAGCVATAMSQIMKYWNHPLQGVGSVTYTSSGPGYPTFPNLSANFGETTYDWDNMPVSLTNSSPQEQKEAVATLMYHCGVSVHMKYAPDGSGANSQDVPGAISTYFKYTNQAVRRDRTSFSYADWYKMLKEQIDMGWPVYYSGCDASTPNPGCHAFVCDGYDDAGLMHWNFGWSGTGDNFIDFDAIEYSASYDACVINFVPVEVYNATPQAPTNFTVTPAANNELKATLTWTNPTKTLNNTNLTTIDQIVVVRDGRIIYTENNVTPGATMTVMDNEVPRFDVFQYEVYAVSNDRHGRVAYADNISFGPTCAWTINITQAAMNGFRGAAIHVYNAAGREVASVTATNSTVQSFSVDVPLGSVSFGWSAQTYGDPFNMGFIIKDAESHTVYTYSGQSSNMAEGIFYEGNNSCGNSVGTGCPTNLVALVDEVNPTDIHVSWDPMPGAEGYGYSVYRDDMLYRLIPEGTSFVDEDVEIGGHCYYVSYFYDGGENGQYSNESCASAGTCYPPTNIDFEYVGDTYKVKLKWEKPEPHDGLSGYFLFRKYGEDGTYQRIKTMNANTTSYTDNTLSEEGHYYYKLYAYYQGLDCYSAPAAWKYDDNQFYLHVYFSTDAVNEQAENGISIYPNPTTSHFTVEGEGMNHVTVFNLVGQKVYEMECQGELVDINLGNAETGVYMVRISTANGEVTKRITVIR